MIFSLQEISARAFEPFGRVISFPSVGERLDLSTHLANLRVDARAHLAVSCRAVTPLPYRGRVMERHRCSGQTFIPIDVSRYVVAVAPDDEQGEPDLGRLQAFVVSGDRGITYHPNVWHCPMAVLDRTGSYVVFIWRNGSPDDEEILELDSWIEFGEPA